MHKREGGPGRPPCGFFPLQLSQNTTDFTMAAPTQNAGATAQQPPATAAILPGKDVLIQAAKLAIDQDKPIQLDYYVDTATKKAFLGEDQETKEKMLVKSNEEFTSLIQKVYKVGDDFIIITENSIYLVSGKIEKRRIQAPALRGF